MLGNALVQQRKYEPAIAPLKTFVEKDRRSKNREWAMTLLAQAYEQTGKPEQAAAVARELSPVKRALAGAEEAYARLTTRPTDLVAPAATPTPAAAHAVRVDVGTGSRAGPRLLRPPPSPPPVSFSPRAAVRGRPRPDPMA